MYYLFSDVFKKTWAMKLVLVKLEKLNLSIVQAVLLSLLSLSYISNPDEAVLRTKV